MSNSASFGIKSWSIDWQTVIIYVLLVLFGWLNIYAAVYNDDHSSIFNIGHRYGMQMVWIGISFFTAISIILIDSKFYHILAYPLFWLMLGMMIIPLIIGKDTNGAKSWIEFGGGIKLQPVEFMKIATALALARFMSSYNFDIKQFKGLYYIGMIIAAPILIILLQNDTGSALVFLSFFFMLYREGFGKILYILVGFVILLGVLSFIMEPLALLILSFMICVAVQALINHNWRPTVIYVAMIMMMLMLIWMASIAFKFDYSLYYAILIVVALTIPLVGRYAFSSRLPNIWAFVALFAGAVAFTFFVDYAFDNLLQVHQQKRILDLLGIENDPKGWSYNVIQSKIAIGSGGLFGKGFLEGTQTRFSFVPEQDTDFIFCTVGEEWGFMGTFTVVALFVWLIIRLMIMGERQKEPFARVYCYSVAAIFFMHFFINISMTIGLFPVVGIPLPFFSYGGSSLLAFTVMLFIAIRLDCSQTLE